MQNEVSFVETIYAIYNPSVSVLKIFTAGSYAKEEGNWSRFVAILFFFFFFSFSIPKKSSQIAIEYFKIILIRFQIIIATLFFPLSFFYFATNFDNFSLLSNTSCFVLFFFPRIDNKFVAKNKFRTNTERKAVF